MEKKKEQITDHEHEFCLRCGRRLKNVQARVRGYGEICYKKNQQNGRRLFPPLFLIF